MHLCRNHHHHHHDIGPSFSSHAFVVVMYSPTRPCIIRLWDHLGRLPTNEEKEAFWLYLAKEYPRHTRALEKLKAWMSIKVVSDRILVGEATLDDGAATYALLTCYCRCSVRDISDMYRWCPVHHFEEWRERSGLMNASKRCRLN